jgi:hypothetical protein
MPKLYFSNADVNSIVYSFAVATSNGKIGTATNILDSLKRLYRQVCDGRVDCQDVHVVYHGLMTCFDEMIDIQKNMVELGVKRCVENKLLETAEHFNQLWKLYTRTCHI